MLRTFATVTAVSALMLSGALAQSTQPSDSPAMSPPAATSPSTSTPAPSADSAAPKGDMSKARVINSQSQDQWLASKFKGTDVVGADDQKIGDINDILFDKNGKILAYVVGVGGFLGIGTKDVALAPESFTLVKGDNSANNNSDKLKVSVTKDELKQAASFEPYKEAPRSAGTGTRPAGGTTGTSRTGAQ
jgi:PRC-barrel domain